MKLLICILPMMASAMSDGVADNKSNDLTSANNAFSAKMFEKVVQSNPGKSVVMSGFSALSPLAQLGLAAGGESHDEILRAINMPNNEAVKSAFSVMNKNLRSVKGINLQVANRVYVPSDVTLNKDFLQTSRDVFGSDAKTVNFAESVLAANTINNWVEEQTNNRIQKLVSPDSLSADTQAVLVNAIYFKGKWKKAFDASQTTSRDFHVTNSKTIKVPTMKKSGYFMYGDSAELDAQLLELPYEGDEASLLIVLPKTVDGINELQKKLADPSSLSRAKSSMYSTEVDVYLPRFKIETTIDLKDVLIKIGVTKLFQPGAARLDHILENKSDLYVSDAIQKAFIEVNEEGTEAAAASAFVFYTESYVPTSLFNADRPFYFELRQNSATIFNGVVTQPTTLYESLQSYYAFAVSLTAFIPTPPPSRFVADHPFIFYIKHKDNTLFTGAVIS